MRAAEEKRVIVPATRTPPIQLNQVASGHQQTVARLRVSPARHEVVSLAVGLRAAA